MRTFWNAAVLTVVAWLCQLPVSAATDESLRAYVQRPDPAYAWSLHHEESGLLARYYFLRLQSQTWLDDSRVDRSLWWHELRGAQPRSIFCGPSADRSTTAVLIISGGSNRDKLSKNPADFAGAIARNFCRPVFELKQVPNQKLTFADETEPRKEDELLAYSAMRSLKGDAADWPAHKAMVKSTAQAMTAIQEFSRQRDEIPDIEDFVLIGASKRGWTAWLTGAVDDRVRGIIPVVIDVLNIEAHLQHHLSSYGEYAPALTDYAAYDIACSLKSERGDALLDIIDPYRYRTQLSLPKFVLNSAGDEFFISDSSRFYYDDLPGNKRLRYTLNTDPGQGAFADRFRLFQQAGNWVDDIVAGREPPDIHWRPDEDGAYVIETSVKPAKLKLWRAHNPKARDFRLETLGPEWTSETIKADKDGVYRVKLETPEKGWTAYLAEATFGGWFRKGSRQTYTTQVKVFPEALPYSGPTCDSRIAANKD